MTASTDLPGGPAESLADAVFPIVGIGASAGGIAALSTFFEQIDAPLGMAFVVIMHLSPNHESNVAAILQRTTKMPVTQVGERTAIHADHVYVIPPNKDLQLAAGHLVLHEPTREGGQHVAVDFFLRALAESHGDRAFAIILSGLGSDGSVGVRRINECGGVTIAQLPSDAEFDSMPKAAIATGLVDMVLPLREMPRKLGELWTNMQRIRLRDSGTTIVPGESSEQDDAERSAEKALKDTLSLLHKRTRHDFRHYKRATVLRRIERRLQVNAVPDLAAYRVYLDQHPAETSALLQDMLISVTSFFRDADAFAALEKTVIPALFDGRESNDVIRVWISACATGEEAYTFAILLREHAETLVDAPQIQIFATDIDERAIAIGRAGLYPEGIANDIAPNRLRRFFQKEGDRYRVVKSIRESVLFAVHNVLRDPPFSRLDLISCRNLLIYLDSEAQRSMLDMFRFALRAGGYLFLGASESTDAIPNAFQVLDKKQRIFEIVSNAGTIVKRAPAMKAEQRIGADAVMPLERKRLSHVERHRHALEQYALPSVLVDARFQILHMSPGAGEFFVRAGGTPSHELVANTRPELRAEMSTAVFRAQQLEQPVSMRAVWTTRDGRKQRLVIHVQPFRDEEQATLFSLVTLQTTDSLVTFSDAEMTLDTKVAVQQLEYEIAQLKGYLQETIERSETSTEDLRASNEELQAINEELRSASEELETSKEELQSINEELTTVNYELKTKVEETIQINDDLHNLIASTDIAVVFVDSQLRIKRFTPRATELFNLIPGDVGRSLTDITHRLDWDTVADDARHAFRDLRTTEREARSSSGQHYLARVVPYRTIENKIEGAVMTFVDISSRVMAERRVSENEERLRIATATLRHYAIMTLDEEGTITTWNAGARDAFGHAESEAIGHSFAMLFAPEDREQNVPAQELESAKVNGSTEDERWMLHRDGSRFYASGVTTSYRTGGSLVFAKITRDMTGTKLLDMRRDDELTRQRRASVVAAAEHRTKDEFLAVVSHELKDPLDAIHAEAERLMGLPEAAALPTLREVAERIRRTVSAQSRLIDNLLDLSQARTGKLLLTLERASLRDIVLRVLAAHDEAAREKDVELRQVIDVDDPMLASCDPLRVEQIFTELVGNALKFSVPGGGIEVTLSRVGHEAAFVVSDSGRGIDPSFIDRVFSLFHQESRETSDGGGLGIGLSLVRQLVEAMAGRIEVESPGTGHGATFTVRLSVDAGSDGQTAESALRLSPLHGLRILTIDDSADALQPFAELLRLEGARVVEVHDGAEALVRLGEEPFDLLLCDLNMPRMDGYRLISLVRQRTDGERIFAIAMSGYGRADDVARATAAGFDGHMTKPASVEDCKRLVTMLRQRGTLD